MSKKEDLLSLFQSIADYLEILGENDFKVRAYRKAVDAIRLSNAGLSEVATGVTKLSGVGDGLRKSIEEFLKTGSLGLFVELQKKIPQAVFELMQVSSVGPTKAMLLYKELGINSVGELEYACRENRLVSLKGFGKKTQEKILQGIEAIKQHAGKLRLDEAVHQSELILSALAKHVKSENITLVGALGRKAEIVEKVEFFINASSIATTVKIVLKVFEELKAKSIEVKEHELLKQKTSSVSASLLFPIQVWMGAYNKNLIRLLCVEQASQSYFTQHLKKFEGWDSTWLEEVWFHSVTQPSAHAYQYSRSSVKGIFHCHTLFSDGNASLEQMVRQAERLGYSYIGISDHSQSAFYAKGLKSDRLKEQAELIGQLQKKVSIRIFHGVESDILIDGSLDYDGKTLAELDFVIASIHSRFQMDKEAMTQRIVKALSNPFTTIWGHPTGRLLLSRNGYDLSWEKCLEAAHQNQVAVELNANPQRLDVDWRLGDKINEYQNLICINPDAHSVEGIAHTKYGEWMAQKARISTTKILNLLDVNEMEKYLWTRKQQALKHSN